MARIRKAKEVPSHWVVDAGKMPAQELADKYGYTLSSLKTYAAKLGVSLAYKLIGYSKDDDKFIRENGSKMSAFEIGEHLGRSYGSVKAYAYRHNISIRKRGELHHRAKQTNEDYRLAKMLIDDGELSLVEIANKLEVPYLFVRDIKIGRTWRQVE